ncbi:hypothetical protein AL058_21840 [Pseudomonas savastanoi pv. nerii]|nr:hypothetical protein AL058_21840 [Pseudomonas savastanoi pv. nerii]
MTLGLPPAAINLILQPPFLVVIRIRRCNQYILAARSGEIILMNCRGILQNMTDLMNLVRQHHRIRMAWVLYSPFLQHWLLTDDRSSFYLTHGVIRHCREQSRHKRTTCLVFLVFHFVDLDRD